MVHVFLELVLLQTFVISGPFRNCSRILKEFQVRLNKSQGSHISIPLLNVSKHVLQTLAGSNFKYFSGALFPEHDLHTTLDRKKEPNEMNCPLD